MLIYTAYFEHETNTFSPVPTPIERFSDGLSFPKTGEEGYKKIKGTKFVPGGFVDAVEEAGLELKIGPIAGAEPSGIIKNDAYQKISERIFEDIKGCDGILLGLHGAMVTEKYEDGEGALLKEIRKRYPNIPMAITLDMHGNLYNDIIINSQIAAGYQTYPHVDMHATALKAGRLLIRYLNGEINPTMVWGNAPMIPHVMRQGTDDSPNKELQELCREYEKQGALAVSLFTGFPHADIKNAGLSVVVVTDNDEKWANEIKNDLLAKAWQNRKKFVYQIEPLEKTVREAKIFAETLDPNKRKPVVLLDHFDNTASGGTCETTEVLREVIKQGLDDVAFYGIWDPEAVKAMEKAGIGKEIELTLGGKFKIDCFNGKQTQPITLKGKIKNLTDGKYQLNGSMGKGLWVSSGPSAVLDIGNIEIIIISKHMEPFDRGCYYSMGIDPTKKKFLLHKSRIHYRTDFMPIVEKVFECCGFGVCTSDYSTLKFENLRRPIFPLDEDVTFYENLE